MVLFEDEFDTVDFSLWDATSLDALGGSSASVVTTEPHRTPNHAKFTVPGVASGEWAWARKDFNVSLLYVRAYFMLKDLLPPAGSDTKIMLRGTDTIFEVKVTDEPKWHLGYLDGTLKSITTLPGPTLDVYYCVELYGKVHATLGEAILYINGVNILDVSGIDSSGRGNIVQVRIGQLYVTTAYAHSVYMDSVKMDDEYIGIDGARYRTPLKSSSHAAI